MTISNVQFECLVVGISRGLATWREAAARSQTTSQLAMVLHALESAIAWDKSIMKAVSDILLVWHFCNKKFFYFVLILYRTVNFVKVVMQKTNYYCAMDAIKAIILTVSNQKWTKFPMEIGKYFSKKSYLIISRFM